MKPWLLSLCLIGVLAAPSPADTAKESYQKRIQDDLNHIDQQIQSWRQESQSAGTETRAKVDQQVNSLQQELAKAQKQLETLEKQTEDNWEKFRKGLDKTVNHLHKQIQEKKS